ncbi:MAG: cytochrome oxidase subunit III [Cytophagales bacterium]|nr:MAG: cytochrome oxidase subunit III [Cytophagales bacterium]
MNSVVSKEQEIPAFRPLGMNPLKFSAWLFIVSIIMVFASLTSAFIVRRSEGNWLEFELPILFWYNTVLLLLSSVTMHFSYLQAKKDNFTQLKIGIFFTAILGIGFLILQFYGWIALVDNKVFLVGNPAGSFVYILSGLHGAHIIAGVIFLLIVFIMVFQDKIHSKKMLWIEICTTFWHFLDGLWLYLFLFLILNR